MASLRGLFIILGITAFAGIGGLYALEELSERSHRAPVRQLPKYKKDDDNVEPYMVEMEPIVPDVVADVDAKTNTDAEIPEKEKVIFQFHDSDDEHDEQDEEQDEEKVDGADAKKDEDDAKEYVDASSMALET